MHNISLEHTNFILNGHRCRGWGNVADALQFPDIEMAQTERGADGQMVASSTGVRGGEVMLKLMPNSPTFVYLMQKKAEIDRGAAIQFNATSRNAQTGITTRLERGVLKRAPAAQTVGNATPPMREFTIDFETIITDTTGARILEPPTAS